MGNMIQDHALNMIFETKMEFGQRRDQDWSTSTCMEDQMLVDARERKHINMDPTMVLAQQRMHVGSSAHEVDRNGLSFRNERDNSITERLEIGTNINKRREMYQQSFRPKQELLSDVKECNQRCEGNNRQCFYGRLGGPGI